MDFLEVDTSIIDDMFNIDNLEEFEIDLGEFEIDFSELDKMIKGLGI